MSANRLLTNIAQRSPWLFLLSIAFGLSGAIFNGIGVTLIIPLILDLLGQDILSTTTFPPALRPLFALFENLPEDYRALAMVGVLILALLLKNLAFYGGAVVSNLLSRSYVYNLRKDGLRLLLDVDLDYHANVRLGDLMNNLNTEVNRVAIAVRTLDRIATLLITILVFLGILVAISWQLTLVSTLLMAVVALANQVSINQAKGFGQKLSKAAGRCRVAPLRCCRAFAWSKPPRMRSANLRPLTSLCGSGRKRSLSRSWSMPALAPPTKC